MYLYGKGDHLHSTVLHHMTVGSTSQIIRVQVP